MQRIHEKLPPLPSKIFSNTFVGEALWPSHLSFNLSQFHIVL
jgi:hypothetical protein